MMKDWSAVIEHYKQAGRISDREAQHLLSLEKEGALGLRRVRQWLSGHIRNADEARAATTWALLGMLALPPAAAAAATVVSPIRAGREYGNMKREMSRRFPDIISKTPEGDLKAVFHVVRSTAPFLTANPILAAAAVKESIDLPHALGLDVVKKMMDIQRASRETIGRKPGLGVVREAAGAGARSAVKDIAKSMVESGSIPTT